MSLIQKAAPSPDEIKKLRSMKYLMDAGVSSEEDIEKHKNSVLQLKLELEKAEKELSAVGSEKREAAENYKTYLCQIETDYDRILRQIKEEQEKAEDIREQQVEQKQQSKNYRNEYER